MHEKKEMKMKMRRWIILLYVRNLMLGVKRILILIMLVIKKLGILVTLKTAKTLG